MRDSDLNHILDVQLSAGDKSRLEKFPETRGKILRAMKVAITQAEIKVLEEIPDFIESKPRKGVNYPIGGYAPGSYQSSCFTCGKDFIGDKRSGQCEPCAINILNESYTKALLEISRLKEVEKVVEDLKKLLK